MKAASGAAYLSAKTSLRAVVLSRTADVSTSAITGESAHHPDESHQLAAISAAFGVVIAAAALQLDSASARNIQPAGSIGRYGWISGNGYEFRMYPLWYERATVGAGSQLMLTNEPDMAEMTIAEDSVQGSSPANKQLLSGVQPITLDGVHGLRGTLPGTGGDTIEQWRVTRDSSEYFISVQAPVAAFPAMKHGLTFILSTWHWSG